MTDFDIRLQCLDILMGSKGYEVGDLDELMDDIERLVKFLKDGVKE